MGVYTTSDSICAPFLDGDSAFAHAAVPDSFQVLVKNLGHLSASLSGDRGADWLSVEQPFTDGSDSTWYFLELVGDIDNGRDGAYSLVLKAYYQTEPMIAQHFFQISGINTNTLHDNSKEVDDSLGSQGWAATATGFSTFDHTSDKVTLVDSSANDISLAANQVKKDSALFDNAGTPGGLIKSDGLSSAGTIVIQGTSPATYVSSNLIAIGGNSAAKDSLGSWALRDNPKSAGDTNKVQALDMSDINGRSAIGDTNSQSGIEYAVHEVITDRNIARDSTKDDYKADISSLGICAFGNGTKPLELYVIDTSGTDDSLASVSVFALDASSSVAASDITVGPGVCTLYVDPSATYDIIVRANGYHFDALSVTTSSGTSLQSEDVQGYDISLTATPSSHQTTLSGQCLTMAGDTLSGCKVTIALTGATAFYSSTNTYPRGQTVVYSDSNGDWTATIIGTDSLSAYLPSGSNQATYTVIYEHPSLQPEGRREMPGLKISANGSTTELRDVLAQ